MYKLIWEWLACTWLVAAIAYQYQSSRGRKSDEATGDEIQIHRSSSSFLYHTYQKKRFSSFLLPFYRAFSASTNFAHKCSSTARNSWSLYRTCRFWLSCWSTASLLCRQRRMTNLVSRYHPCRHSDCCWCRFGEVDPQGTHPTSTFLYHHRAKFPVRRRSCLCRETNWSSRSFFRVRTTLTFFSWSALVLCSDCGHPAPAWLFIGCGSLHSTSFYENI